MKKDNDDIIKERIIDASISALRKEGLKFSVDTLADDLGISKKTVYKFFPDKQALALALYEKYYDRAEERMRSEGSSAEFSGAAMLRIYFDAKTMTRAEIFNKYLLNAAVYGYVAERNDRLWRVAASRISRPRKVDTVRVIVDGAFEKLCESGNDPEDVIEILAEILW